MRENVDHRQLHQRSQPQRRTRIVAEDEIRRAEGPQLRYRKAVGNRGHGVLADAKMQIPPAWALCLEISRARKLERGPVRGPDIGRAAQKPRYVARYRVERCARRIAPGDSLWIRCKYRQVPVPPL